MSASQTGTSGDGSTQDGAGRAARDVGEEVKAEARRLREQATEGARRRADEQKDAAGAYLHTLANAVSSGADTFRRDGLDGTGALLDRAADEITHVADRLGDRRPEELLRDVEGFARRHPAVFFGSAALLAFGATRLLKSSAPAGDADAETPAGATPGAASVGTPPGASAGGASTPVMGAPAVSGPTSQEVL